MLNDDDKALLNDMFLSKFKLNKDDEALVVEQSLLLKFQKNEIIYTKDRCLGFMMIKSGELEAFISHNDFKQMKVFSLKSGDSCVICHSCVVSNSELDINLHAKKDTNVLLIPAKIYKILKQNYHAIDNYTLQIISKRFADTISVMQQALFLPLVLRIRNYLSKNAINDSVIITHEELASNIASAREAVSRVLKEMQNSGEIELGRGTIIIKSLKM